jgi:hypothetical protein
MNQNNSLKRKASVFCHECKHISFFLSTLHQKMDTPIVLCFYIKPSSNSSVIRSIVLKEYFRKLTSNVEVLYPTQVHNGLLLCKSQRSKFQFIFFQ